MRNSSSFLLFVVAGLLFFLMTILDAVSQQGMARESLDRRAALVSEFGLSDLALSTEARYTRHLTLADRHSAFQDHPTSFDHFPSGSIYLPPFQLTND